MSVLRIAEPGADAGYGKTILSSRLLHDLRNPLNQIIGYAEMLTDEAEGEQREHFLTDLENIRTAGRRMLTLIENNFTSANQRTVAVDETEDEMGPEASRELAAAVPGTILIVDDDAANHEVLSRQLARQGHHVTATSNGSDALEIMREMPFDLVLLDIMMPDIDGYELLGMIKADESLKHIPVIMISVLNELQSVVRCIEAGAEDYLTKPFDPTLLRARIGASLEKKRGRDRETILFDEVQKNYKRLQEVERMRDDMRRMIVHDLRTPLTAVIVGVDLLEKHGALNETQRSLTSIAVAGGKTLLGLINDLLDVDKMESGAMQLRYDELSASRLIARAVEQVASLASVGETTLVTNIEPDLPSFRGDENLLSRALVNLIGNAIKFTGRGTVTINASRDDAPTPHILFSIRDTGAGIPSEAFERIFDKFGQLDSRKTGTGLGLAFCKLAVQAHGGEIAVASSPGEGSTFSFTIPID